MIRWTTPTLSCEIELPSGSPELEFDYLIFTLTDKNCHYVNKKIDREQVIQNKFDVELTEEETQIFRNGRVYSQLNIVWGDKRFATNIVPLNVTKNLYNKELIPND